MMRRALLAAALLLAFASSAEAIVCTGTGPCTVTVKATGGDYTSLSAALTGESADLVTATRLLTIECYDSDGTGGADDNAASTGTGYTTSSSYYINITVPAANRHAGVWDTSKYHMIVSNAVALAISEDYVVVDGLQISNVSPGSSSQHVINLPTTLSSGANLITIKNCIIKGNAHATNTQAGINLQGDRIVANIYNNIVYNIRALSGCTGIMCNTSLGTPRLYNNTVIGGDYAIRRLAGTTTIKNNYAGGSNTSDYTGTFGTSTTNACEDTSAACSVQSIAVDTNNFTNVTSGSEDFRLPSTTALDGVGTDDPASGLFSTDITGATRTSTWDIGADEYIAAGGSPVSPAIWINDNEVIQ